MKIEIVGPKKCSACDTVKRHFRELGIPFTSRIADEQYRKDHPVECNKYRDFPHIYLDGRFWFYGAVPKNTIQRVIKSLNKQSAPMAPKKVVRGQRG